MAPQIAFSSEQLTWVIFKYGELKSIIKVMRAISDLKTIIEDFIASIDPDLIKKACASAR